MLDRSELRSEVPVVADGLFKLLCQIDLPARDTAEGLTIRFVEGVLDVELNSATDNPMVFSGADGYEIVCGDNATLEDQEAMEKLHTILPNDTRITTAQMPVGCGIQLMVKLDGLTPHLPLTEDEVAERKRWRLESEVAAIDRFLEALDTPLGGAGSSGPGTSALSSSGLVALAAARRQAEAAAAEMAGEGIPVDADADVPM